MPRKEIEDLYRSHLQALDTMLNPMMPSPVLTSSYMDILLPPDVLPLTYVERIDQLPEDEQPHVEKGKCPGESDAFLIYTKMLPKQPVWGWQHGGRGDERAWTQSVMIVWTKHQLHQRRTAPPEKLLGTLLLTNEELLRVFPEPLPPNLQRGLALRQTLEEDTCRQRIVDLQEEEIEGAWNGLRNAEAHVVAMMALDLRLRKDEDTALCFLRTCRELSSQKAN
ncbi:MAG: hypothetical protein Q8R32_01790 [bacterium]|nr:hypothetical protein [bacterium]